MEMKDQVGTYALWQWRIGSFRRMVQETGNGNEKWGILSEKVGTYDLIVKDDPREGLEDDPREDQVETYALWQRGIGTYALWQWGIGHINQTYSSGSKTFYIGDLNSGLCSVFGLE